MIKTLLVASIAMFIVTGCTTAHKAAVGAAISKKKEFNDTTAQLKLMSPCTITVGTFFRSLTPSQQRATEALCGGEAMARKPILAPDPIK